MLANFFDGLFSELISCCIELDGVIYAPLVSFLSSCGAWFTVHLILWTGLVFFIWQLMDLIKTFILAIFHLIKRWIHKKLISVSDISPTEVQ